MKNCIICDIIADNLKSYIIFENKSFIAFLDIHPVFFGHCLVAPKQHNPTLYDLTSTQLKPYLRLIQNIGLAVEQSMEAQGSFIATNNRVSQSIPHLHTHIIPRKIKDGLKGFFWPRLRYPSVEEMISVQKKIIRALASI